MFKKFLTIFVLVLFSSMLLATIAKAEDVNEIMKKSHLAYFYAADDGLSSVVMKIVNKKGKERVRKFTMLRLDEADGGDQKYYTYFTKPSDLRRLTFMVHKSVESSDKRWLYVPAIDLIKQISADDKNSSFVGSDFTYEDVSGRLWTEDNHKLLREDVLNERKIWVVESVPKEKYKGFSRKVSFIDQAHYLPLREEYYDKKDKLVRIFTAETIEEIDGFFTATLRKMENVKKGGFTTVDFKEIKYNVGIKSDLFKERFLKNPPREFIK